MQPWSLGLIQKPGGRGRVLNARRPMWTVPRQPTSGTVFKPPNGVNLGAIKTHIFLPISLTEIQLKTTRPTTTHRHWPGNGRVAGLPTGTPRPPTARGRRPRHIATRHTAQAARPSPQPLPK